MNSVVAMIRHAASRGQVSYPKDETFRRALNARVAKHFGASGGSRRGGPRMWLKTAVILAWLGASYLLLVLWAPSLWIAIPLAVSTGLAVAAVGFNIMHDGGHGSYSRRRGVNRAMALFLDFIGGSSYVWHWQHNVLHHAYTNIHGVDADISIGPLGRFAPAQRRRWFHRYQYLYVWVLYGLLPLKWWFWDDYATLVTGCIGGEKIRRPNGNQLALLLAGKLTFYGWAIALPLFLHPWTVALPLGFLASFVTGATLGTVFQLAHCMAEAEFPNATGGMRPFSESQVETSVDFCPGNPLVTFIVGGLNFQIEHHLFPQVSHLHYPGLAPIVRETCAEYGVRYNAHQTLRAALASHVRWLRQMGSPAASDQTMAPAVSPSI